MDEVMRAGVGRGTGEGRRRGEGVADVRVGVEDDRIILQKQEIMFLTQQN